MSKLQSNPQRAQEHEKNLKSSADALGQGANVSFDSQTTCNPNRQMQQVGETQQQQFSSFSNALRRDAAAISSIAESFTKLDRELAK